MRLYGLETQDLSVLDAVMAVKFFRKLLWAETDRIGIGRHLINASDAINVPDGGLDAIVDNPISHQDSFIPEGISGFQIKTYNLRPAACKKELHKSDDLKKSLKPKIEWLLDNGGTYFLIIFDETPNVEDKVTAIMDELKEWGYEDPKVEVFVIHKLLGLAERFPSLVAYLKPDILQGYSYEEWETRDEMTTPENFIKNSRIESIMEDIQNKVRTPDKSTIIRLMGLSGIGKTRLVFESLNQEDIKSKVVYVDAENFKNSTLCRKLETDSNLEAIIVADECSSRTHDELVRKFIGKGNRVSIISISNEITGFPSPTLFYELDPLDAASIKEIISSEIIGLPDEVINRIAEFSSGFPRIALLLARNYSSSTSSQEDILKLDDENLINRLIADTMDPFSDEFIKTKKVLTSVALFDKVGYTGNGVSQESKWLSEFFGIDYSEFRRIVTVQKRRHILQGNHYIYVTPAALAIHLTKEWMETYSDSFDLTEFINGIPEDVRGEMVTSFTSRFPYITSIASGEKLVKNLLSTNGIFADGKLFKTDFGASLFLKLTEGDAKSALECLNNTIGKWNKEELLEFKQGRREIIWALERIVIWKDLFTDASRLLLALGEAENELYGNNASGIFIELFSPAPGQVSTTEASPEERFPILIEAINSESMERRKLALKAFGKALQTRDFSRMIGAEYQGGKDLPELWVPKNRDEVFNYYQKVWNYLDENLEFFEEETRDDAINVILERARGIANTDLNLSRMVIKTIEKINSNFWAGKEDLLNVVSQIIHYDAKKMPEDLVEDWINLKKELTGSGFSNLLKRFVGTDLFEDYFHDGELNYNEKWLDSKIQELALKVIDNPELLNPEYSWLTTDKAKRGFKFGYALGILDNEYLFMDKLIEEQKNKSYTEGNITFLGGYLNGLSKREEKLVEDTLINLSQDQYFQIYIPQLSWHSVFNDKIALNILKIVKCGTITIKSLEIFSYGRVITQISPNIFSNWIEFLLKDQSQNGAIVALHLVFSYYTNLEIDLNKDLVLNMLLHPVFWENHKKITRDQMVAHYWKEITIKLVKQCPETEYLISKQMLDYFGDENSLFITSRFEVSEILSDSIKRNPKKMWDVIKEYIGPPIDNRAFHLRHWLRNKDDFKRWEKGALELFDPEDIWKWVEEDLETRAWYLATFIPPSLFYSEDKVCLAREFLVRYGDRDEVRRNFSANYSSGGFSGSMVEHYTKMKKYLLEYKKEETNEHVIKWINEYINNLDDYIEKVEIMEEKEGFF